MSMSMVEKIAMNSALARIELLEGRIHAMKDALGLLMSQAISAGPHRSFDLIDAFRGSVDASRSDFADPSGFEAALHMAGGIIEEAKYWQVFERKCAANLM